MTKKSEMKGLMNVKLVLESNCEKCGDKFARTFTLDVPEQPIAVADISISAKLNGSLKTDDMSFRLCKDCFTEKASAAIAEVEARKAADLAAAKAAEEATKTDDTPKPDDSPPKPPKGGKHGK